MSFISAVALGQPLQKPAEPFALQKTELAVTAEAPEWRKYAEHMTGGATYQTKEARRKLLLIKTLDADLRSALSLDWRDSDRYFAMDVISALQREILLPELLTLSKTEPTGFSILALNTFIKPGGIKVKNLGVTDFEVLYLQRLADAKTSDAAKVILLDTLGRMGTVVDHQWLTDTLLSANSSPEVRGAVLYYLRSRLLTKPSVEAMDLLRKFLGTKTSRQLNLQALFLVTELPPKTRVEVAGAGLYCPEESPPAFKDFCKKEWPDSKPVTDVTQITIAMGYKDARPARYVGDRYERGFVVEELKAQGFARTEFDDDLFKKGKTQLRLVHSSVGPDDVNNRTNAAQSTQSRYASDTFAKALEYGEVIFYVGHSRVGGGPDFEPPQLLKDQNIDFNGYRKTRVGYKTMIKNLELRAKNSGVKPPVFGIFSCASDRHFANGIRKASPGIELNSTDKNLYYIDSLIDVSEALKIALQRFSKEL